MTKSEWRWSNEKNVQPDAFDGNHRHEILPTAPICHLSVFAGRFVIGHVLSFGLSLRPRPPRGGYRPPAGGLVSGLLGGEPRIQSVLIILPRPVNHNDPLAAVADQMNVGFHRLVLDACVMAEAGERLPVDVSTHRRVIAWAKSGLHLGMWNDINTKISERADKSYASQVYVKGTFGATRTEEKKVVEILCV
jgi:hypothetical protein